MQDAPLGALAALAAAALRRQRVQLVEEQHARRRGAGAAEEGSHRPLALADVLVQQLGALDGHEVGAALRCRRLHGTINAALCMRLFIQWTAHAHCANPRTWSAQSYVVNCQKSGGTIYHTACTVRQKKQTGFIDCESLLHTLQALLPVAVRLWWQNSKATDVVWFIDALAARVCNRALSLARLCDRQAQLRSIAADKKAWLEARVHTDP